MTNLAQTLIVGTEPVQVNGAFSTSSFLETFGATPIAGRFFRADEERGATWPCSARTCGARASPRIQRSSAAPSRSMARLYTVIGVAPRLPAFWDADVWTTNPFQYPGRPRRHHSPRLQLSAAGRPLEAGREPMSRRGASWTCWPRGLPAAHPGNADAAWTLTAIPLRDDIVGAARSSLLTLLAAVGLLAGRRVCQRGEPPARSVHRPPAGNRLACRPRRLARPHRPAVPGREPVAERDRGGARRGVRVLGAAGPAGARAEQSRVCQRHPHQRAGAGGNRVAGARRRHGDGSLSGGAGIARPTLSRCCETADAPLPARSAAIAPAARSSRRKWRCRWCC